MNDYQCWFCAEGIDRTDIGAVKIDVESLWRWDAGSLNDDEPLQCVFAHSKCAKEHMAGATMDLEPSLFGDDG